MIVNLTKQNLKAPELPNVMKFEEKFYLKFKKIISDCFNIDPNLRLTATEI